MKTVFALLSLLITLTVAAQEPKASAPRPNFITVLIDDMGWGDFSCFGNKEAKTPHIDRLATEGGRFSQFYVNSPICSPCRCALITGQYPQRWRLTSFLDNHRANQRRGMADWLDPAAQTFPRLLQTQGYATGHFGKWHLGGQRDVAEAPPITRYGFDESLTNFEGMGPKLLPLTLKPGDTEPGRIWADAERLGQPFTWRQRSQITGGFVAAAQKFITTATTSGKPFYVNVFPDDVHTPLWPPVTDWREGKRAQYLAVLENMDRQLGVLFDFIRSDAKLRDTTVLLVLSDNGPEPGAGSAGPLRGSKGTLYEGGIRSPLVVWAPGFIEKGKTGFHNDRDVFAAFDLAPSILTLARVPVPEGVKFDGVDHSAVLLGKGPAPRREPLCWRRPPDRKTMKGSTEGRCPDLAIRDGEWKLLCDYDGSQPQLYQPATDPGEKQNLAVAQPETVARLTKSVLAWHTALPPDNGPALGAVAAPGE
jgi:arylsulfatase A-like enzyme